MANEDAPTAMSKNAMKRAAKRAHHEAHKAEWRREKKIRRREAAKARKEDALDKDTKQVIPSSIPCESKAKCGFLLFDLSFNALMNERVQCPTIKHFVIFL